MVMRSVRVDDTPSTLRPMDVRGISGLNIVENAPLERLLLDRNNVGWPFRQACNQVTRLFVAHVMEDLRPLVGDLAELILLSKGLCYPIASAFGDLTMQNMETNVIATTRRHITSGTAVIEVPYARLDSRARHLVIGDTVASGSTICRALHLIHERQELKSIHIFAIAGAINGARRISQCCRDLGIEVTFVFGLAAFGLGANGFDLSFLHPDTITSDRYRAMASDISTKPISAAGWDFGAQAFAVEKYTNLCWAEAEYRGMHGSTALAVEQEPRDWRTLQHEQSAFHSLQYNSESA